MQIHPLEDMNMSNHQYNALSCVACAYSDT